MVEYLNLDSEVVQNQTYHQKCHSCTENYNYATEQEYAYNVGIALLMAPTPQGG